MDGSTAARHPLPLFSLRHQGLNLSQRIQQMSEAPVAWGGFSEIYQAVLDSETVAVKVIKGVGDDETSRRKFKRECVFWSQLIHVNIAAFLGFAEGPRMGPFGALISLWCENGDASSYIAKKGPALDFSARMDLWIGVISGVEFLHEHSPPLVHGDLKPKNVLIDSHGCPKLCDFGLARLVMDVAGTGLTTATDYMGTARYVAPELLQETASLPTKATDIWALGCVGLEFIYSIPPYSHRINNMWGRILQDIKSGRPPARRESIPRADEALWNLFESCWSFDPSRRLLCRDLKTTALAIRSEIRRSAQGTTNSIENPQEWDRRPTAHANQEARHSRTNLRARVSETGAVQPIKDEESALSAIKEVKTCQSQERHAEAATLCTEVLEWQTSKLGENHPQTISTMGLLAHSYHSLGRYVEAVGLWVKVLEWQRLKLGETHEDTISTMDGLAISYWWLGHHLEATDLLFKVLKGQKSKLGDDHEHTINTMGGLAIWYCIQGRYTEAVTLQLKVLEWRRSKLGETHEDTISTMNGLATSYRSLGRHLEATDLLLKVLKWQKSKLGDSHEHTINTMGCLAVLYYPLGQYTEAMDLQIKVLEWWRSKTGDDHEHTINAMGCLAVTYYLLGRYGEAVDLQVKVLKWKKSKLGENHEDTINTMVGLAMSYQSLNDLAKAVDLLVKVIEWRGSTLGEDHEQTMNAIDHLAHLYRLQGRNAEATNLQDRTGHRWSSRLDKSQQRTRRRPSRHRDYRVDYDSGDFFDGYRSFGYDITDLSYPYYRNDRDYYPSSSRHRSSGSGLKRKQPSGIRKEEESVTVLGSAKNFQTIKRYDEEAKIRRDGKTLVNREESRDIVLLPDGQVIPRLKEDDSRVMSLATYDKGDVRVLHNGKERFGDRVRRKLGMDPKGVNVIRLKKKALPATVVSR